MNAKEQAGCSKDFEKDLSELQSIDVGERDEIVKMWRHLDETLEDKAKSLNLNTLNVKSILFHLIKNPQVIPVILGLEDASAHDIPEVKLTRSKTKKSLGEADEVQPVIRTVRTFLGVNYDNDDEDDDYRPEEDNDQNQSDLESEDLEEYVEEEEEEDVEPKPGCSTEDPFASLDEEPELDDYQFRSRHRNLNDSLVREETCSIEQLDDGDLDEECELMTTANPEYLDFIYSINQANANDLAVQVDDDDLEDEEYNVLDDILDVEREDSDEIRGGRATEIPKREVVGLLYDMLSVNKHGAPVTGDPDIEEESPVTSPVRVRENVLEKTSQFKIDEKVVRRMHETAPGESCSLLKPGLVTFRPCELKELRSQLQQHVQLLTQTVVLCYHDSNLQGTRNSSQLMINELESKFWEQAARLENASLSPTLFNIPNLEAAIKTCHDVIKMTQVNEEDVKWSEALDAPAGQCPRPEVVAVLSRSAAIIYPHLIPKVQSHVFDKPLAGFLKSENLMLLVSLLQFAHLPRRASKKVIDRYTRMSENCLPSRSGTRIRIHMKTMRCTKDSSLPIHEMIAKAEQGMCTLAFQPTEFTVQNSPMNNWPEDLKPRWLKHFSRYFVFVSPHVLRRLKKPVIGKFGVKNRNNLNISDVNYGDTPINSLVRMTTVNGSQAVVIDTGKMLNLLSVIYPSIIQVPPQSGQLAATENKPDVGQQPIEDEVKPSTPPVTSVAESFALAQAELISNDLLPSFSTEIQTETTRTSSPTGSGYVSPDFGNQSVVEERNRSPVSPDSSGNSSIFIPETPGKRPLSQLETSFIEYGEDSQSNYYDPMNHQLSNESTRIPPTPRTYCDENSTSFIGDCSRYSLSDYLEDYYKRNTSFQPPSAEKVRTRAADEDIECALFFEPPSVDDRLSQRSRKRSRIEKEDMGAAGMVNVEYRYWQTMQIAKKIAQDVRSRMFMHQEMWTSMQLIMADGGITEEKRVELLEQVLSSLPDVFVLVSAFLPEKLLPAHVISEPRRVAFKNALDMMMSIEAYMTAAKLKQPNARQMFRMIATLGDENLNLTEARQRMFELLGNERPLWNRIEKYFHSSPYNRPCKSSDFEFIDLTLNETFSAEDFMMEKIDDIDAVLGATKVKSKGPLHVYRGHLMATHKGSVVPVDVSSESKPEPAAWTREMDALLLMTFKDNESMEEEDVAAAVLPKLPFKYHEILERLKYLLSFF
ncbi:unnamed protein product [Caenorhabditis auriculariae]|uniref:Uncharacterized protein n=1 Tax=Caenorhabditis auriculariae TaxID=2777116 RepID=A0A8S1HYG6_9PELO|nr:unnamed protein product [Caenorhabditis auriculariae]